MFFLMFGASMVVPQNSNFGVELSCVQLMSDAERTRMNNFFPPEVLVDAMSFRLPDNSFMIAGMPVVRDVQAVQVSPFGCPTVEALVEIWRKTGIGMDFIIGMNESGNPILYVSEGFDPARGVCHAGKSEFERLEALNANCLGLGVHSSKCDDKGTPGEYSDEQYQMVRNVLSRLMVQFNISPLRVLSRPLFVVGANRPFCYGLQPNKYAVAPGIYPQSELVGNVIERTNVSVRNMLEYAGFSQQRIEIEGLRSCLRAVLVYLTGMPENNFAINWVDKMSDAQWNLFCNWCIGRHLIRSGNMDEARPYWYIIEASSV